MNATAKHLTALGQIADNCNVAQRVANDRRDKGYNPDRKEGEAFAYNEAYKIMKAELQRLRNLLQNGSLTQADFGDDLPY